MKPLSLNNNGIELRPLDHRDWPLFLAFSLSTSVMTYIADPVSKVQAKQAFKSRLLPWDIQSPEWLTFSVNACTQIQEKSAPTSSKKLGSVALRITDHETLSAEVGVIIKPGEWGRGYATMALGTLLSFAQKELKIEQFQAICACENISSIRVLEKAGFTQDTFLPHNSVIHGRWFDDVVLRLNVANTM